MEVAVDTNCLISALITPAKSRELICSPILILYAPDHIISETLKHKEMIIGLSGIMESEFYQLVGVLLSNIKIISEAEFKDRKGQALTLVTHPEDVPFMALALFLNIPLWSNDKELKGQNIVKVFTTTELLKELMLV